MTPDFFYNSDHVYQYLSDSIIKIGGVPSLIIDVGKAGKTFKIYYIPSYNPDNVNPKSVLLTDEDVNLSPICLGYFNKARFENSKVCKVLRKPSRDWKIGIHSSNIKCFEYTDQIGELLHSRPLFNLMINNFPSFEEALNTINKKESTSVASNRKFALKGYNLHYLLIEEKIGIVEKNGSFSLLSGLEYLAESLEEAVNNEN